MKKWVNTVEYRRWRDAVKERDGMCMVCKRIDGKLDAHHLIPKNFKKYRNDITNGLLLCVGHHTLGMWSAHKNPIWFTKWLEDNKQHIYWLTTSRLQELG